MAATPYEASYPNNSFLFEIYNDGQPAQKAPKLPGGPCHFADTAPGANGPRCGCRRFWSRQAALRGTAALGDHLDSGIQAVWCMCNHHACYHDEFQPGAASAGAAAAVADNGQENERPRTTRAPLSPVQDIPSFHVPADLGPSMDFSILDFPDSFSGDKPELAAGPPVAFADPPQSVANGSSVQHESSLPDTLPWGEYIHTQAGMVNTVPPIPPQCLMPSQNPPSTASSSQARYLRPFAGKGLQTLSGASATRRQDGAQVQAATGNAHKAEDAQLRDTGLFQDPNWAARQRSQANEIGLPSSGAKGPSQEAFQQLSNTVQGHEQRLDRLENTSFSVAGHEECHDKHENADLRLTDLELRVEEVEKIINNDSSSLASTRRFASGDLADDATASVVSVSTNATSRALDPSEMFSQIQALQAQVNQLQASSMPSYNSPWEVEVVFLPFPLKGIWMAAQDFPAQTQPGAPGSNADEWTQMPNTVSRSAPDSPPGFPGHHAGSDWLLPRACAPGRIIDGRLKSRGLIKTVSVKGPDARSIQLAVNTAFSDVLRLSPSDTNSRALVQRSPRDGDSRLASVLGLQQSWVPLRKIHKDSRLRFLTPAEMVTPALWDVAFLKSSVVMKASGVHRLYITQREAYLQDHPLGFQAFESGWTWQKLRELTRVYPDSQSSSNSEVPEADALEECWTWNERLDETPSPHSSSSNLRLAQAKISWKRSSSSSQQFFTGIESPMLSTSPTALRGQSPLSSRTGAVPPRPSHIRTNSLPTTAPIVLSPSHPSRRVASYSTVTTHPYERRPSPLISRSSPRLPMSNSMAAASSISKRRQPTRSPSLIPRNTPRWSRASMSRSPSLAPLGGNPTAGFCDDRSDRRTTPFCYATPYSNAPPEPQHDYRAGSRGPVSGLPAYYEDGDDDANMEDDDDRGSSTDPYDSEMTSEVVNHEPAFRQGNDTDVDIDVYEDEPEDGVGQTGLQGDGSQWHGLRLHDRYYLNHQSGGFGQGHLTTTTLPEDEPWPGIPDHMSDGENINPSDVDIEIDPDAQSLASSDASSQPSEYPSTQRVWQDEAGTVPEAAVGGGHVVDGHDSGVGFKIHEDGDADANLTT